mgnify:CR=1 FL=1
MTRFSCGQVPCTVAGRKNSGVGRSVLGFFSPLLNSLKGLHSQQHVGMDFGSGRVATEPASHGAWTYAWVA